MPDSSELAQASPGATASPGTPFNNNLPKWYPRRRGGRPVYHGNEEALGWVLDGVGRAIPFIYGGAFFGSAILKLAREAAGCATEPLEGETVLPECTARIYGIRPSSYLTTYTMIIGVASAALLPLMGAVVDYTNHRLLVGKVTSALFVLFTFPQIFLSIDNWFSMAVCQILASFFGWGQTAITYAYLPELTSDEMILNDYTKSFTMAFFFAMTVYLAAVIVLVGAIGYGDSSVVTARVGAIVALAVSIPLIVLSWGRLFKKRDAMHQLRPDQSLWTAGFIQLYHTMVNIAKNYRALKWFYLAIAMSDSGLQALATIAVTYLTAELQFTARENGIAILCFLLGSVPGAVCSNVATRKLDPIKSSMSALVVLIIVTSVFAALLSGPGQQKETYILCFFWGIGIGWKWTCDRMVASCIIPAGQDAELMGLFLFSGQSLSWLSPLVFTAVNESGVSQQVGVATLNIYFVLSFLCYWLMGGYARARQEVNRETQFEKTLVDNSESIEIQPPTPTESVLETAPLEERAAPEKPAN